MTAREEVLAYALSFADVYTERPFRDQNWQLVRIKGSKKTFLWIYDRGGYLNLNVKVAPEWRDFWRNTYPAVVAGYHQNKMHWNTIILDGTIPTQDIKRMIAESYDLIADSPTKRIYEAVSNALHKNPDPANIPCYRVVNAKGELSGSFAFGGEAAQEKLLQADGIEVINGRVDLEKYQWKFK